jgi:hypothetical protein
VDEEQGVDSGAAEDDPYGPSEELYGSTEDEYEGVYEAELEEP